MTGSLGFWTGPPLLLHHYTLASTLETKSFPSLFEDSLVSFSLLSLIWRDDHCLSSKPWTNVCVCVCVFYFPPHSLLLKVGKIKLIKRKEKRWGRHPVASALPPKPLRFQRGITFAWLFFVSLSVCVSPFGLVFFFCFFLKEAKNGIMKKERGLINSWKRLRPGAL